MLSGDCNVCINRKMPSYSATCVECGLTRKNYKPMTNGDRIRRMTDEEMAMFLQDIWYISGSNDTSNAWWLCWLKQEEQDG